MTTPLRQFILKRGNTAVSSVYTGPTGEITYDTGFNAIRIHDGITPGGNLMPSNGLITAVTSNVSILQANVATLFANAATQAVYITSLQSDVSILANLASSSGAVPPNLPAEGALWYDTGSGRLYVYYDGFWIDASPETVYTLPTATANVLGGVKIGANLNIVNGVLSANTNLGNLGIANQTIYGTQTNQDIELAPNGTGFVAVPKLKIPVGTLIQGTAPISVTIANLTLNTVLDYSTSSSDNLVTGDYNLPNGVSGAGTGWAVYEFTTNPSPVLEIGDHIAGVGVPFLSNVIHIGTGPNANVIITDQTITAVPPANGEIIYTTRDVVNAGLNITTVGNTDISLIPGTGGHIVTTTDIIPFVNDVYNLGTPARRFKQVWLGAGTLYILDETLGTDQAIGARDGNIYIAGGTGLTVGKFTLTGNTIALQNSAEDFYVGAIGATGNLTVNRQFNVSSADGAWKLFDINQANGYVSIVSNVANSTGTAALEIVGARARDLISPNNPGILLHLTGTSLAPARIYNDSYGAANYSAYIGRKARGNSTVASGTVAGDIISRIGANPFDSSGVFAPISTMRMDFVVKETQTPTDRGNQIEFWTTANASASIARRVVIDDAGIALNTGGVKFVDSTVQTTAWQGDTSLVTVNANIAAANVNIATLFANAASQATALNTLTANAAAQSGDITTLFANAAAQSQDITTLFANAAAQSQDITTLFANAATQATALNTLTANAATQSADITALVANAASQQTQINSAVTVVNAGYAVSVNRVNGTVGIDNLGVNTIAGTANRILVNGGTAAANASVTLSLPQDINTNSTVTFSNLTITGNLTVVGNIISAGANALDSKLLYLANTATSASQLDGGGIVLGNVNAAFRRSILYDFNNDAWDTDGAGLTTLRLNATDANFSGNLVSNGRASFGGNHFVFEYPNAELQIDSDLNSYSQVVSQNHNSGTLASTDWVAVNDIGDDSNYYIDLGINSSTYVNPAYSIDGPNGGYLYINGGNLSIGTQTAGNVIKFHTSGTLDSNLRVTIDDAGLTSVGNVTAQYFVGSGRYLTDLYSNANVTAYLTTDSNVLAIWNNITTLYSNAATQDSAINALRANITAANSAISVLDANLGTATTNITTLFGNAGVQADEINALRANITAANSAIVTANSAVVSYVNTLNNSMVANITAVNLQISNTSVAVFANAASQQIEINALRANITAANSAISALQSNTATAANNINILFANSAAQEDSIKALRANITAANSAISVLDSNLGTVNTNITTLFANAGSQQTEINSLQANITAANSAIVTANSAVVSYVNSLNTAMAANVNAANAAIVTANTGMKSYVDTALTSANLYSFGHFAVAGQSTVDATTSNDTANLIAGTGITITTSGKQITFALDTGAGVTSLYGANNIVLSDSTGNITIQRINGIQSVVTGNSAASANLSLTDQYFGTTRSATGTGTVTLPAGSSVPVGRQYIIKDEGGSSGSFLRRITVAASGSDTIDGSATRGITSNYGSLTVLWTGTRWSVI